MAKKMKKKTNVASHIFRVLGTVILIVIICICIPVTLPKFAGYQMYSVISGSMEPAIKVGSLVYVKAEAPEDIQTDDVIAFYATSNDGSIITHRVVENQVVSGDFITKGDANEQNDLEPIPYHLFMGKVAYVIPYMGKLLGFLSTSAGKAGATAMVVVGILFHVIAGSLRRDEDY